MNMSDESKVSAESEALNLKAPEQIYRWNDDGRLEYYQPPYGDAITYTRSDLGSDPHGKQESVAWIPMGSAPKNGTLIRLLVEPEDTHHTSFTDGDAPYSTIGFNLLEQTSIDAWEFGGWDWKQEVFITGSGTPIGWLPMSAPPAERAELARLRGALIDAERQLVAVYGEPKESSLENKRGVDCILSIRAALAASPAPFSQEQAEEYDIGRRDGYEEAVQRIDMLTGGDGEYRVCTDLDPDRHTPDADTMITRIVDRFVAGSAEVAQARETMEDVLTHKEPWRNALQENCDNADDQAENGRLLDENHALKTASWPDWAEKTLKVLRTHSGADGTDDWEGVDLPGELEEHLSLLDDEIAASEMERLAHVASNERLRKAVEPFALASTEGVIKKASGHETVVTCAEYFHEAAAALAASPAPRESREQLAKRLIAEVVAEAGAKGEHDFGFQATLIAEAVLLNLGIGTDPSREVGADPRRDRISALIEVMLPYGRDKDA